MHFLEMLLTFAVWGGVVALFVTAIACALRRWHFAARLARVLALTGAALLVLSIFVFIVLPLGIYGGEPTMKATVLSQGIAEAVNCGVLALVVAIVAAGMAAFARWRLAAAGRSAG